MTELVTVTGIGGDYEIDERDVRILSTMYTHGALTRKQLAARCGGLESETGLNSTLVRLEKAGLTSRMPQGRWDVTSFGVLAVTG